MKKLFISPSSLLEDSYELAWKIYESGYLPNYIIGVWRGGSPIGIAVQELLHVLGVTSDHIAIRTSYYTGIETVKDDVQVHGLSYVIKKIQSEDRLLIVDDVHDTGISIDKIISTLTKACKKNTPNIKVATTYFKPSKNKTSRTPDYFIHETDQWLVFPHELDGLEVQEIIESKPELHKVINKIKPILQNK